MLYIKKVRADHVIDFAAEELKKYLRMMMPDCGDIDILYDPNAQDGFRLGLLEDFGLPSEAADPRLDDVIHVDTDEQGGILAGSNLRSILFAVYRLLRENGCRWLYPGVDGEYIPLRKLAPTHYHKLADHRFRGFCNEGAESQQAMLDTVDFYAKLELNVYMLEFDIPNIYYSRYYTHPFNEENRHPEPVSSLQVLQWKRQCEVEISKRGLQFHDMGHGWTAEPFGLSSADGWVPAAQEITPDQRECLAMLDGERKLFGGVALNTNLCMSNPRVRTTMAKAIADYARSHSNVDYLHVWLADGSNNHCECPECQKARPSDYYMMIMNELDEILTTMGLSTRIVFICYVDTLFAPETVRIRNPERFSLLYAPITRSYTSSIRQDSVIPKTPAYVRNRWKRPSSAESNLAFLKDWQDGWKGPAFSYEYHFWKHQFFDPGVMYFSRRIYEDVRSLKYMGLDGYVEDGSQRSFFPNGFNVCIYAETLMNRDCDFDAIMADYFSHIYGPDWKEVADYLQQVSNILDFGYISGEKSADRSVSSHYDPARAPELASIKTLAEKGRAIAAAHRAMPTRPQTVSMRLLSRHADFIEGLAEFLEAAAIGNTAESLTILDAFRIRFGQYEVELERYFDHFIAFRAYKMLIDRPKIILEEGN